MADEYIKREDALCEIDGWYNLYPDSDVAREALTLSSRGIRKIPAADVAPVRHGQWNVYSAKDCLYTCSVCHHLPALETPYCPHCGAKMDGDNIITDDTTIPTISNTEYIDTGINASTYNEWKTLQDDEEMLRAVSTKGESVTIDRKNKTLTYTNEYGHTVRMNALKIIKDGEIVWSKKDGGANNV